MPATAATPVQATPVAQEPKKGGTGKCLLIGCCVIIACCVLTIGGLFALVSFGGASLLSSNKTADQSLTRISTPADAQAAITDANTKESASVDPASGNVVVTFTEKDILALAIDSLKLQNNPSKVAMKITPDSAKFEMDLGALIKAANDASASSGSSSSVNVSGLDNIFASITLGVGADGKTITVKDLSVGNGLIDSILGPSFKQSIEQSIQENFVKSMEGKDLKLEKIQLQSGQVSFTFSSVSPTTTP